jgi:hypothetical protein
MFEVDVYIACKRDFVETGARGRRRDLLDIYAGSAFPGYKTALLEFVHDLLDGRPAYMVLLGKRYDRGQLIEGLQLAASNLSLDIVDDILIFGQLKSLHDVLRVYLP